MLCGARIPFVSALHFTYTRYRPQLFLISALMWRVLICTDYHACLTAGLASLHLHPRVCLVTALVNFPNSETAGRV
jgi:hypothetical protein